MLCTMKDVYSSKQTTFKIISIMHKGNNQNKGKKKQTHYSIFTTLIHKLTSDNTIWYHM